MNMKSAQCHSQTLAQRLPVSVTVELKDDNPLKYDLVSKSQELPVKKIKYKGKEDFKFTFSNIQNGIEHDGFEVTFTLDDKTGKGYGFFFKDPANPDANEAFWVKAVDAAGSCPSQQCTLAGFTAKSVTRSQLVVENANQHLQYFAFALALSKTGDSAPTVLIDPIGDNKNGEAA